MNCIRRRRGARSYKAENFDGSKSTADIYWHPNATVVEPKPDRRFRFLTEGNSIESASTASHLFLVTQPQATIADYGLRAMAQKPPPAVVPPNIRRTLHAQYPLSLFTPPGQPTRKVARALTVIVPSPSSYVDLSPTLTTVLEDVPGMSRMKMTFDEGTVDTMTLSDGISWVDDGIVRAKAEVYWARFKNGQPTAIVVRNATDLRVTMGGTVYGFESDKPISYAVYPDGGVIMRCFSSRETASIQHLSSIPQDRVTPVANAECVPEPFR